MSPWPGSILAVGVLQQFWLVFDCSSYMFYQLIIDLHKKTILPHSKGVFLFSFSLTSIEDSRYCDPEVIESNIRQVHDDKTKFFQVCFNHQLETIYM